MFAFHVQTILGVSVADAQSAIFQQSFVDSLSDLLRIPASNIQITSITAASRRRFLLANAQISYIITASNTNPSTLYSQINNLVQSGALTNRMLSNPNVKKAFPNMSMGALQVVDLTPTLSPTPVPTFQTLPPGSIAAATILTVWGAAMLVASWYYFCVRKKHLDNQPYVDSSMEQQWAFVSSVAPRARSDPGVVIGTGTGAGSYLPAGYGYGQDTSQSVQLAPMATYRDAIPPPVITSPYYNNPMMSPNLTATANANASVTNAAATGRPNSAGIGTRTTDFYDYPSSSAPSRIVI
jgi:hypothetical protein